MITLDLSVSIVTYKNNVSILRRTINSVLASTALQLKLYIVDNSPTDEMRFLFVADDRVEYIYMNSNRGFGAGHNYIMNNPAKMGRYHLVLNPDVEFESNVLIGLFHYMEQNVDVGNIMPKILYPNGSIQRLCKLLPTPKDWIIRMFIPIKSIKKRIDYNFEMHFANYNEEMNVPYLSGCFMFLRASVIEEVGVFDEGIFMYGEDTDLNRRIYQKYRTMYYPEVTITHNFEKGSHKSLRLLWIHIKAAIYYLNKWGWLFDEEREKINKEVKLKYSKNNK
ncbi:glycosyltransferase family 2 protein [Bacteroides sp. 51]|uniref:glycosyltransferase family 2 protein n=1 Tax=Bacteroides sp. 51 TaxID=2302938 RepID=UPI0013D4CE2D|nr:glycosyltransferase family 2 protein [Bacteroides sp. 51]NDV81531.1 glycosyltransferase [Bacteroides sp. 51]